LTLVVVPVIYTYLDDFAAWARRKWRHADARRGGAAAATAQAKHEDAV
jgi:HAE1 family hydrophobic/amphiphilic exporter-1